MRVGFHVALAKNNINSQQRAQQPKQNAQQSPSFKGFPVNGKMVPTEKLHTIPDDFIYDAAMTHIKTGKEGLNTIINDAITLLNKKTSAEQGAGLELKFALEDAGHGDKIKINNNKASRA